MRTCLKDIFRFKRTKHFQLDLVGGHGPDAVGGRADVGAVVLLLHDGNVQNGSLGQLGHRGPRVLAVLEAGEKKMCSMNI